MKNIFLYIITVLIWGSTWFAIEFQLGEVAVEISLIYRFALAGLMVLAISQLSGLSLKFTLQQHFYIALLGLLNFCLNYITLYQAQKYMSSAITSIVFSILLLMNIMNTRIFFGKKIPLKTYLGAIIGISGIVVLFWPEVASFKTTDTTLLGLLLIVSGAYSASLGNMVSVRNSNRQYPILQSSGFGMLYGAGYLCVFALFNNSQFTLSTQPSYWISLAYLTIFGTIIAFYSYFYLLKSIGPEKTSYSIVLFPMVAVVISTLFENFEWTVYTFNGFILVALGNLIVLTPRDKFKIVLRRNINDNARLKNHMETVHSLKDLSVSENTHLAKTN